MSHQPPFLRLPRNHLGRDFVIGDIHGHFSRVERELERIGFRPTRDRLICVGDLVDRGPESERAADWLGYDWFFAVMGNHDASLLHRWGLLGAKFELWHDHHGWLERLSSDAQARLRERLAALPWALEIDTAAGPVGIVHAEVPEAFASWQAFLRRLDGSCQTPIAGLAELDGGNIRLRGQILRPDGSEVLADEADAPVEDAEALGTAMAERLLSRAGPGFFTG